LHLTPLWTGLMINNEFHGKTRFSNNYVESWFKHLKNSVLNINKRVRSCQYYEDIANIRLGTLRKRENTDHREIGILRNRLKVVPATIILSSKLTSKTMRIICQN
ncbi:hypothetical protein BpHYR1_002268, partial [Brachionus plicatilis]